MVQCAKALISRHMSFHTKTHVDVAWQRDAARAAKGARAEQLVVVGWAGGVVQ